MRKTLIGVVLGGGALVAHGATRWALKVLADDQPSDWLDESRPAPSASTGAEAEARAPTRFSRTRREAIRTSAGTRASGR